MHHDWLHTLKRKILTGKNMRVLSMQKCQDTWGERQISTDSAVISGCGQPPATLEDGPASRFFLGDDDLYSKPPFVTALRNKQVIVRNQNAATIGRWFDSCLCL